MGGFGSGRRGYGDVKDSVENMRSIDIRRWQREGLLVPGNSFRWHWARYGLISVADVKVWVEGDRIMVAFGSQYQGAAEEVPDCAVWLEATPCHYGGNRYWFRCPAKECGRRVAVLYEGWRSYACRHCHRLAYPSQRETPGYRAARWASKIRVVLGGSGALAASFPDKPNGMHWRTYWRLRQRAEKLAAQFTDEVVGHVQMLEKRLDRLRAE